MKLVLLPGLDGTGRLFGRFIVAYQGDTQVICLPDYGSQDYQALADSLLEELPREPFVLLAESFSGGVAACIIEVRPAYLQGVIFVASFLIPPSRSLLSLAEVLPITHLLRLPIPKYLLRFLFLGSEADDELIEEFLHTVSLVPGGLIKQRLNQIKNMTLPTTSACVPIKVIQAKHDKLVEQSHSQVFLQRYEAVSLYQLAGPHFLLQAEPAAAAKLITELMTDIECGFSGVRES